MADALGWNLGLGVEFDELIWVDVVDVTDETQGDAELVVEEANDKLASMEFDVEAAAGESIADANASDAVIPRPATESKPEILLSFWESVTITGSTKAPLSSEKEEIGSDDDIVVATPASAWGLLVSTCTG